VYGYSISALFDGKAEPEQRSYPDDYPESVKNLMRLIDDAIDVLPKAHRLVAYSYILKTIADLILSLVII